MTNNQNNNIDKRGYKPGQSPSLPKPLNGSVTNGFRPNQSPKMPVPIKPKSGK